MKESIKYALTGSGPWFYGIASALLVATLVMMAADGFVAITKTWERFINVF